jgi:hypothetical protein
MNCGLRIADCGVKGRSLLSDTPQSAIRIPQSLLSDERGSISIASVFALLILVMLMGLVMNTGRQVDRKVKMQNAADAAAQSSGNLLARQMNALAFTNHLLCDVFALTAGLREVQIDPPPPVSDARIAWLRALANSTLPALETILLEERITQYQRGALTASVPLAQGTADGIAQGHSAAWPQSATARAALWQAQPGVSVNPWLLPVLDPGMGGVTPLPDDEAATRARRERRSHARTYLTNWTRDWLGNSYNTRAGQRWRQRVNRQLDRMLTFYSDANLPMVLVSNRFQPNNNYLDQNFHFIGVVYVDPPGERIPGVFHSPFVASQQAYAQVLLFIPRNRLLWRQDPLTGLWGPVRQSSSENPGTWDLWNQNWAIQLVPATSAGLPTVLSARPDLPGGAAPLVSNQWRNIPPEAVRWLSHH